MPGSHVPVKAIRKRPPTKLTAFVRVVDEAMESRWKKIWISEYNASIHDRAFERPGGPRLIAKRGEKLRHHFAYSRKTEAWDDPWYFSKRVDGSKGQWHQEWQELSDPEFVEVVRTRDGVKHIADLVGKNGEVIELQHSPMSQTEIRAREEFYGSMIWLLDATSSEQFVAGSYVLPGTRGYSNFYAVKMEDWWGFTTKPVYLDIGTCLVKPMFMSRRWMFGRIVQYPTFIADTLHYQPVDGVEQKYEKANRTLYFPSKYSFRFQDNAVILGGNNWGRREKLYAEKFKYNGQTKTWSILARTCPPCYQRPDILA